MSFIINPYLQYSAIPTIVSSQQLRSGANPGSSVSLNVSYTLNLLSVIIVHWRFTNPVTLTSVTVSGYSMNIITQQNVIQGATGCGIALCTFRWPLTSASVSTTFNFNGNTSSVGVATYGIFRNTSDTPYSVSTTTKDTSVNTKALSIPVVPKSLNIIACSSLISGSVTFSNSAPPTLDPGYNLGVPSTSPQFQMAGRSINNGSSLVDYSGEIVTVTSSLASAAYATITFI